VAGENKSQLWKDQAAIDSHIAAALAIRPHVIRRARYLMAHAYLERIEREGLAPIAAVLKTEASHA
jgi:hypothetical protein